MRLAALGLHACAALAQPVHYAIELRPDFASRTLRGTEEIELRGPVSLSRHPSLTVTSLPAGATEAHGAIQVTGRRARFEYEAKPGQGFRWLEDGSLFTAFHCGAWMVCDASPGYRATLRLEIVLPGSSGMRVAGPGRLARQFKDRQGQQHFVYEVRHPVQSFLYSFAVAKFERASEGDLEILSLRPPQPAAWAVTAKAYRFFRQKAGVDWPDAHYAQAFLSPRGLGQEAAGVALMSQEYLEKLQQDDVELMAHELAHQWWAVLVGIRTWSDFWLNEGIAEFMMAAFVEHHHGRAAYEKKLAQLQRELDKLRAEGKDRPLHWERWTNAVEALGPVPYRKGALFLARLRVELGEDAFWRGMARYTRRHAGGLAEARDFQRAMEEAAGKSLQATFEEGVYR